MLLGFGDGETGLLPAAGVIPPAMLGTVLLLLFFVYKWALMSPLEIMGIDFSSFSQEYGKLRSNAAREAFWKPDAKWIESMPPLYLACVSAADRSLMYVPLILQFLRFAIGERVLTLKFKYDAIVTVSFWLFTC